MKDLKNQNRKCLPNFYMSTIVNNINEELEVAVLTHRGFSNLESEVFINFLQCNISELDRQLFLKKFNSLLQ